MGEMADWLLDTALDEIYSGENCGQCGFPIYDAPGCQCKAVELTDTQAAALRPRHHWPLRSRPETAPRKGRHSEGAGSGGGVAKRGNARCTARGGTGRRNAMSSYYAQIINLPASVPDGLRDDSGSVLTDVAMAYKYGHRDARHAAAELAIQADQRIEELEAKVIKLQEICDSRFDEINRLRFGSR